MGAERSAVSPYASIRAALSRLLAPGLAWCYRCKTSKFGPIRNEPHTTDFGEGRGCFPLCEKCWSALTPKQRVPFYDQLVNEWIRQTPNEVAQYERDRDAIRKAVLAGG